MPLDERKLRMNQLKKRERRMDVDSWVESFLVGMEEISQGELIMPILLRNKLNSICLEKVSSSS